MATKEQADFYDNFIEHFQQQQNNGRNMSFRKWISKWIYKEKKILDLGCAFGYNSSFLIESGCEVHGIDISPKCILLAKRKYPKGNWHCGDVTEGFDPGVRDFDFIILSDVIEHIPLEKHSKLFGVLGEWTKPDGVIVASVPNPEIYKEIQEQTYQPVEEKVLIPELFQKMRTGGFDRIVTLFLLERVYYRLIVQKIPPLG